MLALESIQLTQRFAPVSPTTFAQTVSPKTKVVFGVVQSAAKIAIVPAEGIAKNEVVDHARIPVGIKAEELNLPGFAVSRRALPIPPAVEELALVE
jgi:hypothetical protein